eukprot:668485-Heterocapsa_arctica.AAC.1
MAEAMKTLLDTIAHTSVTIAATLDGVPEEDIGNFEPWCFMEYEETKIDSNCGEEDSGEPLRPEAGIDDMSIDQYNAGMDEVKGLLSQLLEQFKQII